MKKSITLAALLLALGTSVFAAVPPKPKAHKAESPAKIAFVSLSADKGFAVKISKQDAGKSFVMIYDKDNNVVFKDLLTKGTDAEKGYILTSLDNGDYTVEVSANKQNVKKQLHVYDEGQKKSYIFIQ
jgi:flagellar hook assembly protein FlgD